ncbi:MAG: sulfatase-like hydrolase/transferase [Pirellulales bacterium]
MKRTQMNNLHYSRQAVGAVAAVFFVAICVFTASAAENTRPNIVLLVADDFGWGDISLHGGKISTPNIDQLFQQGVELDTFLVNPVCSPTRAAFLTGRHAARVGVNPQVVNARAGEMMNPKETTLAQVFKSAGYQTAILGKWHLGYAPSDPNTKGFDLFYGFLGAATDYLKRTDDEHTRWMLNDKPAPDPGYSTELIRDRAIRYIAENKSEPFFLYVPFNAVHNPVQSAQNYIDRVPASVKDPQARTRAGMVIALDDAVGAIVKKIDDEGLGERTIVVFFSDNGPTPDGDPGPFRGRKHTVYEGGVRSPTAIRWTGQLKPGTKTTAMLAAPDLFPSLLKMTDVPLPENVLLDGRDFSACLTSGAPSPRDEYYWLWMDCDAIRTARYKLVRYADRTELYDLQNDIAEANDIAKQRPQIAANLEQRLDAWEASVPIYPTHIAVKGAESLKPQPSGDVLEVIASRDRRSTGKQILGLTLGSCERFSIGSGDRVEFDILFARDSATNGVSVELAHPARQKKRGRLKANFADGDGGTGATARQRKNQWSHRAIGLANRGGRMLDSLWLGLEGNRAAEFHLYLDNVIVRRADGTTIDFYRDGKAPQQKSREAADDWIASLNEVPLTELEPRQPRN